jgi:hypothetical protein
MFVFDYCCVVLKDSDLVAVPTDKTNSFCTMDIERYKMEVNKQALVRESYCD